MTVTAELELAHARDVTITECQERLRDMARVLIGAQSADPTPVNETAARLGQHFADAADALDTLRTPTEIPSETRARLKQAGELSYLITRAAAAGNVGPGRFDSAGPSFDHFASDLWTVMRLYELVGKEGATTG
jgi:hypothetical protein